MITAGLSDKILRRLASICGTDEVCSNPDLALYEREVLDSVKTVELILAIEEEFGLYVSPADFERQLWATPRKIIADIQHRLKS
ncbi:MAG TPA: D-alanine--poly(phosphoribitol) ligase subunit DltC [Chthoniobacterales bacterium]|nr:D-alanine--poly(phosphoribitol) ligase subunit DltC [Chthoniobacterales bacterium]HXY60994.1 D-alanine--poly(phosphoribitol) ligase subunit DltC [Chthoniobacterales bacterium]